jgi:anaerobic selenocysteine-containing dehydrogenase
MSPAKSPDAPTLSLHPDDAARLGVSEGERLAVESDAGDVESTAHLDASLKPGVVCVSHGWYETNVCALTSGSDTVDPLTCQPRMTAIPVTLRRRTAA